MPVMIYKQLHRVSRAYCKNFLSHGSTAETSSSLRFRDHTQTHSSW